MTPTASMRKDTNARAAAPHTAAAQDEDFWSHIQQSFDVDRSWTNLNNGVVSPAPRVVLDAMRRHVRGSRDRWCNCYQRNLVWPGTNAKHPASAVW